MSLSPELQEQYDTILIARQVGAIDRTTYNQLALTIARAARAQRQAAAAAAIAAQAAKDKARRDRRAAQARARRAAAKKTAIKSAAYYTVSVPVGTAPEDPLIYEISNRIQGSDVIMVAELPSGPSERTLIQSFTNLPGSRSGKHRDLRKFFQLRSDLYITEGYMVPDAFGNPELMEYPPSETIKISLYAPSETITPARLQQAFADGARHCVISPIVDVLRKELANSESDSFRKRVQQRIRKLEGMAVQYAAGVPEGDAMEEVARAAGRKLIIEDTLNQTYTVYHKNAQTAITFTNTRENHLEAGHLALDTAPTIVTADEMAELVQEHRDAGKFFEFEGLPNKIRALHSLRGSWRVANPLHDVYERHNTANNMNHFGLDAAKHPEVNRWLRAATIVNAVPLYLNPDVEPTRHHDIRAAYTQSRATGYYAGVMGVIHQWRSLTNVPHDMTSLFVARYQMSILKFRVIENPVPLFQQLGLTGTHALPAPELRFFLDHGVKVQLLSGVFGSRTDINWGEEIRSFRDPETKNKAYGMWAGCLGHDQPNKALNFIGSKEWAGHLAAIYGQDRIKYNGVFGHITAKVAKKTYRTKHHMLAFITSYVRIIMMEQMLKLRPGSIQRVVLDGIYHNDEAAEFPVTLWADKEFKESKPSATYLGWYPEHEESDEFMTPASAKLDNCVLAGAGGTGKTHSILTDTGFNDVLYVVPQHLLGQGMRQDYGNNYTTIHKLIGEGCQPYCELYAPPPGILIDEATMISGDWIDRVFKMYPNSLIMVAGDLERRPDGTIWALQCRGGKPGEFAEVWQASQVPESQWIYYTTDHRAKCDKLRQAKLQIRQMMRDIYIDGGADEAHDLAERVWKCWGALPFADAVKLFQPGDTWLAGTHATNRRLLRAGVVSGYLAADGRKSQTEMEKSEKRGSYTTHSFQGQTIRDGRVFISIGDNFELAMLYTALSRAVSWDQIVLVD
ncbi:hypothetical protein EBZ39_08345 [bacterium]|nr:hypothetical protein [bacterium]